MKNLIKYFEKKMLNLNLWDISVLKIDMLILGMIFGAFFSVFVIENLILLFLTFLALWIYLILKFFSK